MQVPFSTFLRACLTYFWSVVNGWTVDIHAFIIKPFWLVCSPDSNSLTQAKIWFCLNNLWPCLHSRQNFCFIQSWIFRMLLIPPPPPLPADTHTHTHAPLWHPPNTTKRIWSCRVYSYQFTAVSSSASSASPMTFGVPQGPVLFVYMYVMCVCMSQDSLLVRAPDSWAKGCELNSRQERQENFLLQS